MLYLYPFKNKVIMSNDTRSERQRKVVKKWIENGYRGTAAWCTGSGKTRIAIIAIKSFLSTNSNKNIKVIVPTEHLKIQWISELSQYFLNNYVKVEIINTAIKTSEVVDLLVLDEAHRYAAETFIEVFNKKNPRMVLGLSATFSRLDGRHKLLERYCPVIDTVTIREAIDKGWVSNYVEYKVNIEVDDIEEYKEASREFSSMFSMFNYDFQLAMSCVTNVVKRRTYAKKMGIPHGEMDGITFSWLRSMKARKAFVLNHPKKIEITRKILDARPFSKAITFSGTIKQAEKIGIGHVLHSGKTKKKNRLTMEEFNQLPSGVLNTSKKLDEGADIQGLNLAIILSNSSSKTQKTQRIGRAIRFEEGKKAEIFTLVIKDTVENNWFLNSSEGNLYIEINEQELDEVLAGEEIELNEQEGREVDEAFRM